MAASRSSGGTHGIVVGAGVAGLAAARALSGAFDMVTVLDADDLPTGVIDRRGTPQSRHIHALLTGGEAALEELAPGFSAALDAAGAPGLTHGGGFGFRSADGWIREVPELRIRNASRALLEGTLRRIVRADPSTELSPHRRVDGLLLAGDGRVRGVRARGPKGEPVELRGDLVVDASGRGSPAPRWLEAVGLTAPPETVVDARVWYSSTVGRGRLPTPAGTEAFVVVPSAAHPAGAGITAREGGYTVSLSGFAPDDPPSTPRQMLDHARRASTPLVARVLEVLDLEDDIHITRSTSNRLRAYHAIDVPPGLVAIGDSVCCFDPIYGQGMSVAAVQATALRDLVTLLGPRDPTLTRRFQARAWEIAQVAWQQAVAADAQLPTLDRRVPASKRPLVAYVQRVRRLTTVDPEVARRLGRVMHLLDAPDALFDPWLARRVLRDLLRPAAAAAHPADRPSPERASLS